jgi:aspartate carbamoyltransferase
MTHLLSCSQFTDAGELTALFDAALRNWVVAPTVDGGLCGGRVLATLFLEPSTRTRLSFERAMLRLGGQVLSISDASTSSIAKGETIEDTVRVVGQMADVLAIRTKGVGQVAKAANHSPVPVINAGDGSGEHPTQALQDVFTIHRRLKSVNGIRVMLVGDLKHSRTIHSLIKLLNLYSGIHLFLVPSAGCEIEPLTLIDPAHLRLDGYSVYESIGEALIKHQVYPDVVYLTRSQTERWGDVGVNHVGQLTATQLTVQHLTWMKEHALIMHPLPRVSEMGPGVDIDPRSVYFTSQIEAGFMVRAELIRRLLAAR